MYNKTKRVFDVITAVFCILLGVSGVFLVVWDFKYFENTVQALKFAIPAAVFAILFCIVGFILLTPPKIQGGVWKSKKNARIAIGLLCPAFAFCSFVAIIVFLFIAIGIGIGASLGGNVPPELRDENLFLNFYLANIFAAAGLFVINIIAACIKTVKK